MALVNCPECGKQVSSTALACPNCGYSVKEHFEALSQQSQANSGITPQPMNSVESKVVVRTGSYGNNPNTFKYDTVGLFDEYGNKVLSLNTNQTKSFNITRDMTLTAYHLKPDGTKQTMFGADQKLKSNSVQVKNGQTTSLEISFVPNFLLTQLVITVVDFFV